ITTPLAVKCWGIWCLLLGSMRRYFTFKILTGDHALFDPPSDQPQSVGDLIGRAFRVYRRNIPLFFKVLLGPTIFATGGALGLQWAITYGVSPESTHTISLPLLFGVIVCSLVIVAIAKWVLVVRQLAFVRIMAGFAGDYPTAYQFVAQRKWAV